MLEEVTHWLISFLKREYHKSMYKQIMNSFFQRLKIREIPTIDWISLPEKVMSPYILVVIFIVFLGLSDHGLSFMGTLGVVLGISGFLIGMHIRIKRLELSEKYFYLLLFVCAACVGGMIFDWSLFQKLSLVPLILLFLTGKHTQKMFFLVLLGSIIVLSKGFWAVALPYIFLSLIFLATTIDRRIFDDNLPLIAFTCLVVGLLFWVLDILLFGGFPLLTPEARGSLDTTYTMLSHALPVGCVMAIIICRNRTSSFLLVLVSVVLMALLGYRTQVILVMLASCFAAFLTKVITGTETVLVLAGTGGLGLLLTSLRDIILQTQIGIIEAVQARVSVTLDIYDMMANLGGIFGYTKGEVHIAAVSFFARMMPRVAYSPRRYIAEMVGMDVSATSTILGPLAVDFGLIGVFVGMAFLGYLLSRLYKHKTPLGISLYCVVLAYSIIGIETGIVDLEVILIFFFSFLYVLTSEK